MTQTQRMRTPPVDPAWGTPAPNAREVRDALEELYVAARVGASDAAGAAAIDRAYRRIAPLVERAAAEAPGAADADLLATFGLPPEDVLDADDALDPLDPFGMLLEGDNDVPLVEVDVPWQEVVPPAPVRDPLADDPAAPAIRGLVATIAREADPRPLAVILFGSHARGDYRARSDVDLLVVVPAGTDTRRAAAAIDALLPAGGMEVDVLAATPARLAAARGDYSSVLHRAQEHGAVLYRADADADTSACAERADERPARAGDAGTLA